MSKLYVQGFLLKVWHEIVGVVKLFSTVCSIIWKYFDGRKTQVSAAILGLAIFIEEVLVGIWGLFPGVLWLEPTLQTIRWVGMGTAFIGFGHKTVKTITKTPDTTETE